MPDLLIVIANGVNLNPVGIGRPNIWERDSSLRIRDAFHWLRPIKSQHVNWRHLDTSALDGRQRRSIAQLDIQARRASNKTAHRQNGESASSNERS